MTRLSDFRARPSVGTGGGGGGGGDPGLSVGNWDVTPTIIPGTSADPVILDMTSNLAEVDGDFVTSFGTSPSPGSAAIAVASTNYVTSLTETTSFRVGSRLVGSALGSGQIVGVVLAPSVMTVTEVQTALAGMFSNTSSGQPLLVASMVGNLGSPQLLAAVDTGGQISLGQGGDATAFNEAESVIQFLGSSANLGAGFAFYAGMQFLNAAQDGFELIGFSDGAPLASIASEEFRVFFAAISVDMGSGFSNRSFAPAYAAGTTTVSTTGTAWETELTLTQTDWNDRHPDALNVIAAITPEVIIEAAYPATAAGKLFKVTGEGPKTGVYMNLGDLVYFSTNTQFLNTGSPTTGIIDMNSAVVERVTFSDTTPGMSSVGFTVAYERTADAATTIAVAVGDVIVSGSGVFYEEFSFTNYGYTASNSFVAFGFTAGTATELDTFFDTLSGNVPLTFMLLRDHGGSNSASYTLGRTSDTSVEFGTLGTGAPITGTEKFGVLIDTTGFPDVVFTPYLNGTAIGSSTFTITNPAITTVGDLSFKSMFLANSTTVGDAATVTIPVTPASVPVGSAYIVNSYLPLPDIRKSRIFTIKGSGVLNEVTVNDKDVVFINEDGSTVKNLSTIPIPPPTDLITYFYKPLEEILGRWSMFLNQDQFELPRDNSTNLVWDDKSYGDGTESISYTAQPSDGQYIASFTATQPVFAPGALGFAFVPEFNPLPPSGAVSTFKSYAIISDSSYTSASQVLTAYNSSSFTDFVAMVEFEYDYNATTLSVKLIYHTSTDGTVVKSSGPMPFLPYTHPIVALDASFRSLSVAIWGGSPRFNFSLDLSPSNVLNALGANTLKFHFSQEFEVYNSGSQTFGLFGEFVGTNAEFVRERGYNDLFYKIGKDALDLVPADAAGKLVKYSNIGFGGDDKYLPIIPAAHRSYMPFSRFGEDIGYIASDVSPNYAGRIVELIDVQKLYYFTGTDLNPVDGERILGIIELPFKYKADSYDHDFTNQLTGSWTVDTGFNESQHVWNATIGSGAFATTDNFQASLEKTDIWLANGITPGVAVYASLLNKDPTSFYYPMPASDTDNQARSRVPDEETFRAEVVYSFNFGTDVFNTESDVEFYFGFYNNQEHPGDIAEIIYNYSQGSVTTGIQLFRARLTTYSGQNVVEIAAFDGTSPQGTAYFNYSSLRELRDLYTHTYRKYQGNESTGILRMDLLGNLANAISEATQSNPLLSLSINTEEPYYWKSFYAVKSTSQPGDVWPTDIRMEYHPACTKPYVKKVYGYTTGEFGSPATVTKLKEQQYIYNGMLGDAYIPLMSDSPSTNTTDIYCESDENTFGVKFNSPIARWSMVYLYSFPNTRYTYGRSGGGLITSRYKEMGGKVLTIKPVASSQFEAISSEDPNSIRDLMVSNQVIHPHTYSVLGSAVTPHSTPNNTTASDMIANAFYSPLVDFGILPGSGSLTINLDEATTKNFSIELTSLSNASLVFTTTLSNSHYREVVLRVVNGGLGTVNFTGVIWQNGTPPTFTSSGVNMVKLYTVGSNLYGKLEF